MAITRLARTPPAMLSDEALDHALAELIAQARRETSARRVEVQRICDRYHLERIARHGPAGASEADLFDGLKADVNQFLVANWKPKDFIPKMVEEGLPSGAVVRAYESRRGEIRRSATIRLIIHFLVIGVVAVGVWQMAVHGAPKAIDDWAYASLGLELPMQGYIPAGLAIVIAVICFFGWLNALGLFLRFRKPYSPEVGQRQRPDHLLPP